MKRRRRRITAGPAGAVMVWGLCFVLGSPAAWSWLVSSTMCWHHQTSLDNAGYNKSPFGARKATHRLATGIWALPAWASARKPPPTGRTQSPPPQVSSVPICPLVVPFVVPSGHARHAGLCHPYKWPGSSVGRVPLVKPLAHLKCAYSRPSPRPSLRPSSRPASYPVSSPRLKAFPRSRESR